MTPGKNVNSPEKSWNFDFLFLYELCTGSEEENTLAYTVVAMQISS